MRKQHRYSASAGLLALAVSIGTNTSAQTTFASSNNPSATLRIEAANHEQTVVHVRQHRDNINYVPLSQNTVLRDKATGISYPLRSLDVSVDPSSKVEVQTLSFSPFLEPAATFELLDPTRPNQALYFKEVVCALIKE